MTAVPVTTYERCEGTMICNFYSTEDVNKTLLLELKILQKTKIPKPSWLLKSETKS